MMLIADSGSTKADWWLLEHGEKIHSFKTVGLNPYFISSEKIIECVSESFNNSFQPTQIKEIFFYGTGCSSSVNKDIVKNALNALFPEARYEVEHDLLGAARALRGRKKGMVGILGTGSNSCVYDGVNIIDNIFSVGYMFGDEGSGAYLGKKYITDHLKNKVPNEIFRSFAQTYGFSNVDILTHVYKKPNPNRFLASFAVFLKKHIDHPYVVELVEEAFMHYFREQIMCYENYRVLPFSFLGSVGCNFLKQLQNAAQRSEVNLSNYLISPMEGLVAFHKRG